MPSYDYATVPTINAFAQSNAFIRGLMGPFGGGKSSGCVMEIARRGIEQTPGPDGVRRSRFAVVRNSYRQLEDSTIKTFLQWFPPYTYGDWKPSAHSYTIRALTAAPGEPGAEIEVLFRALDRPDQIGNLLSTEYTGAWFNEGRDIPWAVWEAMMGRVGRYPAVRDGGCKWFGIFGDTNPPDTDSEWYKFFEEKDHTEDIEALNAAIDRLGLKIPHYTTGTYYKCFKQPSGLGPNAENIANLPPLYYEKQRVGKTDDWVKVYLHGEYGFTVDGKPVFPEYSDTMHCPEDPRLHPKTIDGAVMLRSYDFGLTPACVFSQLTPNCRWNVVDEIVATDMGFDEFSDTVLEHSARHYRGLAFEDVGDPAGQQRAQTDTKTCFQIAHAKGINMMAAPQTEQLRLESMRKPLRTLRDGRPQFTLHPRCVRLRKALLGGYHFRRMQVSGERFDVHPNKNAHSHVADACTYGAAWLFGSELRSRAVDDTDYRPSLLSDRTRSSVTGY